MSGVLRASFVRVPGQRDRIYVQRSDGSEVSWIFPTYGDLPPHDLVHLVVESAFGLRAGFWGRVDAGVDPARINEEANRKGGADKYRGYGEDQRELLLAEGLAASAWFDADIADDGRLERLADSCRTMGVEPPEGITLDQVAAVRAVLERLRERWRAIGSEEKGTIALTFRPDDPASGLADLVSA